MEVISKDILIRASQGDMGAFEKIYKATSGFVFSVSLRITGNKHDAEEATQDVFMRIYKNLKRFQFRSSFRTWVYRIAVNAAINSSKKASQETARRSDYDTAIKTQCAPDAADEIAKQKDSENLIASLLSKLNPDQRACIVLREMQGLSYSEISRALRVNINTVRSRLKRARESLLALRKEEVM
jgi:RNA polymerase sigma-70 factor (ECF subfamily)